MKSKFIQKFFAALALLLIIYLPAQATEVAITVDDIPLSGPLPPNTTRMQIAQEMLAAFKKHHIKDVYGFINGVNIPNDEFMNILYAWVNDGQLLGNHTYMHNNLARVSTEAYINDINKNDPFLKKAMGNKDYKYFRYPFLSEGNTPQKRDAIRNYLASQGYKIAPVTIDFSDWEFNPPYVRCLRRNNQQGVAWVEQNFMQQSVSALQRAQAMSQALFNRDIKQILLIHIGACDAKMVDQLLTAYEQHGVKFIPLNVAMSDPAYQLTPSFSDTRAFTYLNQIRKMKGLKSPPSVNKFYISFPSDKLNSICR